MTYRLRSRDEHFANDGSPKRILALDGGGLRGILTLGYLGKIEAILRERHQAGSDFRLCHYFDMIAGTSTGAIIAAGLAKGWTVAELAQYYLELGNEIFAKEWFRFGLVRAKYDAGKLIDKLRKLLGDDLTLGSEKLKTGLLVVTKRLDTGSPWPLSNNPHGKYFADRPNGTIGNGRYPLWQVVRASTAAPVFFDSEHITITTPEGARAAAGNFVDGGVSPFNNPALQALMYATLDGYRVGWPLGADKLLIVSVGTGASDPSVAPYKLDIAARDG